MPILETIAGVAVVTKLATAHAAHAAAVGAHSGMAGAVAVSHGQVAAGTAAAHTAAVAQGMTPGMIHIASGAGAVTGGVIFAAPTLIEYTVKAIVEILLDPK